MNVHSSPQMMVAKPKQGTKFLCNNLGLGLVRFVFFCFFIIIYTNTNFVMIINIIII